jgi:class 3 adenylate cyclase
VIEREGDFFGRTVNVAARASPTTRGPHEVLVSDEARTAVDGVKFEPVGHVPLKRTARPVRLHRATRA